MQDSCAIPGSARCDGRRTPAAGIDFRSGTPFQIPWNSEFGEQASFLVEIASEVDKSHKRALAKILMNFVAFHLGRDEALAPRWDFLRRYVRTGDGEIKARLSARPFWTGQETDQLRFQDDSINVRIENLQGNIVGAIQFYNLHTYEMILVDNDSCVPTRKSDAAIRPASRHFWAISVGCEQLPYPLRARNNCRGRASGRSQLNVAGQYRPGCMWPSP